VSYAGGRELKTPFGTFYGPNITPHQSAGIGRWTEADFMRAIREGVRPDGAHYFPAFPYPSFTRIVDADLRDLWAYLRSLPPDPRASRAHDLRFPFGWRFLVAGWKWFFFTPGALAADPGRGAQINRGAYLVLALGHCGECHTPRNLLGGPSRDRFLAGTRKGPDGKSAPNLTPTRLKNWSDADLRTLLQTGFTPDGDVVAETMVRSSATPRKDYARRPCRHDRIPALAASPARGRRLKARWARRNKQAARRVKAVNGAKYAPVCLTTSHFLKGSQR
jgi:mono/diheme cytochrome c family protein